MVVQSLLIESQINTFPDLLGFTNILSYIPYIIGLASCLVTSHRDKECKPLQSSKEPPPFLNTHPVQHINLFPSNHSLSSEMFISRDRGPAAEHRQTPFHPGACSVDQQETNCPRLPPLLLLPISATPPPSSTIHPTSAAPNRSAHQKVPWLGAGSNRGATSQKHMPSLIKACVSAAEDHPIRALLSAGCDELC